MSKKNKGIPFDFYLLPQPEGVNKKRYYAKVVNRPAVSHRRFVQEMLHHKAGTEGNIEGMLVTIGEVLREFLSEGYPVHINGIGTFSLALSCPETRTPDATRAPNIAVKRVTFRADSRLNKPLKSIKFSRDHAVSSLRYSEDTADKLLTEYFRERGFITRKQFAELTFQRPTTAYRRLRALLEAGRLENVGTARRPLYQPTSGNFGK